VQLLDVNPALIAPAPLNANVMSPAKYRELVTSIRRIGFVDPVVIHQLNIGDPIVFETIDGHHRLRAAVEVGLPLVPALVLQPGEDRRLVALALNRLRGETDLTQAGLVIAELLEDGLDPASLSISGFTERELDQLVAAVSQDADDVELDDLGDVEVPTEVGAPVARPFLLELTFQSKAELAEAKKILRKAAGKGVDLAEGLLRLGRAE
jgi:ParB-like chromosome segregation protein Spo0J